MKKLNEVSSVIQEYWVNQGGEGGWEFLSGIPESDPLLEKLELEPVDKILELVKKKLLTRPKKFVTITSSEEDFLPASSLQIGVSRSLPVCRIARYFPLKDFKKRIEYIQDRIKQRNDDINFNSVEKIKEIFLIPDRVADEIFKKDKKKSHENNDTSLEGVKLLEELKENIQENQLYKLNPIPIGTGFLVGASQILTNKHLIENEEIASQCVAQFNYAEDIQGYIQKSIDYDLAPELMFISEPNLDFTLVQLKYNLFRRQAGYEFGWLQMVEDGENIVPGFNEADIQKLENQKFTIVPEEKERKLADNIIIIHHPKGKQKKIDVSNNLVSVGGLYKNVIRYKIDSDYGSSGSPIFNNKWELVAIHHRVVISKNNLDKTSEKAEYTQQQGIRICRIVEDLKKKSTSNSKLASFIEDFVVTSEQLNYPPFSSGLQFNGSSDFISMDSRVALVDGKFAFASCATNFSESVDRQSTAKGISIIKLWNSKGIELKTCVHAGVRKVAFSPDGKILASAGGSDGSIKIWNVEDGALLKDLLIEDTLERDQVISVSFSPPDCPRGKLLASATVFGAVKLWNLEKGTLLKTPEELVGEKVGFSPDGKTVISASSSSPSTIKIWNLENETLTEIRSEHIKFFASISFSYDSKILATGNGDGTIQLWNLENGELLNTLTGHTGSVFSINFNSDSQTLLSVGGDWTIRRWSLDGTSLSNPPILLQRGSDLDNILSASFSYDAGTIATFSCSKGSIELWNVEDGSMLRSFKHFRDNVSCNDDVDFSDADVSFSPNIRDLSSADWNVLNSSESVTIEAWISSDVDGGGTIASLSLKASDGESCQFSLNITPIDENCGYVGFNLEGSVSITRSGGGVVFFGKFNHVAATINFIKEKREVELYINGHESSSSSSTSRSTRSSSFSPRLTAIAAFVENPDTAPVLRDFFKGCITEVRLWKVALTEEKIKANMSRRLTKENPNWSDLVGYWRFEECQGDKVYNSVNADEYGAIAGAKWLRASQYPALPMFYGLRFNEDREDSYIECTTNNLDTRDAIAVEAWVKHKFGNCLIVSRGGIVGSDRKVNRGYSLAWVDGKIRVALSNETSQIVVYSQDNAPRDRIWHHVAFSWDKNSQEVALYIDGRRQNNLIEGQSETIFSEGQYKTIGLFSGDLDSLTEPLIIGRNASPGSYYDVAIAEVRLWNIARPQDQIKSQMSKRLKGNENHLIGYWRLDDGSKDDRGVIDLSSNQNHGTIDGTKQWFPPTPPPNTSQDILNATS